MAALLGTPLHAQANCQLSEILDPWPFEDPADALREGYDGCAWCMPALHTG